MNAAKSEFMVMAWGRQKLRLSNTAYARCFQNKVMSYAERQREIVICDACGKELRRANLGKHHQTVTCFKASKMYQPPTPVRERYTREYAITPDDPATTYRVSIPSEHN